CPRSRCRVPRGRANRGGGPTASVARRARACWARRALARARAPRPFAAPARLVLSSSSARSFGERRTCNLLVPVAADEVVVDHADRLHEGVHDGRPDELEAARRKL